MIPHLKDSTASRTPVIQTTCKIGSRTWTFETGRLARLIDGSIVIRDDQDNVLLTTVGIGNPREGLDFFPLSVDFVEKYYASGKIGGNRFQRREGRPSEQAILTSRLIDRPIRPLFPNGTRNEVQIISTILSANSGSDFGYAGITGASLAILLSGAEGFEGPVSGVRLAYDAQSDQFVFDPSFELLSTTPLDITVAGTHEAIVMVESECREAPSDLMVRAFNEAHELIKILCNAQEAFVREYRQAFDIPVKLLERSHADEHWGSLAKRFLSDSDRMGQLYHQGKKDFDTVYDTLLEEFDTTLMSEEEESDARSERKKAFHHAVKSLMRARVIETQERLDGRSPSEVRPLRIDVGLLPRTHGSALFERGMTQILSVTTLGGPSDALIVDDMFEEEEKRYIHHYNFPPYAVGETRPLRATGRREVGHGRLAEKALQAVLPSEDEFPYIMRVVSETLTCNGSSSMASVCGSSLSLMDAGVPIKRSVAGIAMGMIYDEKSGRFVILSDIQAQEDFLGDMDFKIAATSEGITALQMDCKIPELTVDMIRSIFVQAKNGLNTIRGAMDSVIAIPRAQLSQYAPLLKCLQVPEDKMRDVIGRGGEMIQSIEKNFHVEVNLEDNGFCTITARDQMSGQKAYEFIISLIKEIEVGDIFEAPIIKILDTVGAIVELSKGKEGMIHISKFGVKERIANVNDVAKISEIVTVRVYNVDKEKGRIQLEKVVPPSATPESTPQETAPNIDTTP